MYQKISIIKSVRLNWLLDEKDSNGFQENLFWKSDFGIFWLLTATMFIDKIQQFPSKILWSKDSYILYPLHGNLTTQIAIFSVFHISNTARSTVIIAMHILTGASVTYGPIGPPKFCLFMKHREKSTTCGSFKVHIFWEGHKIFQDVHLMFDCHFIGQK